MKKIRIISLVLAIMCFSIFGISIYISEPKNIWNKKNKNEYEIIEETRETVNKEDRVGINTRIKQIDKYSKCGHEIIENIKIDNKILNKNYTEFENLFKDYHLKEFNNNNIIMLKEYDTYCPEHFVLKDLEGMVAIYTQITDDELSLYQILDVNIKKLREYDKILFKKDGLKIYGRQNLYGIIEDYDS